MESYKYHFTYRITNLRERKYYYGVHSTNNKPEEELGIKYFSSSSDKDFIEDQKNNPNDYKYKVLKIFSSRIEAQAHEIRICERLNVKSNPHFYNKANPTFNGFIHDGRISCYHKNKPNEILIVSTEEFRNDENLISIYKGIPRSEEVKKKMKKPKSKKGKENIAKSNREQKFFGEENHFFGKKHSEETKRKMVENRKKNNGGNYHPNGNRTAKRFLFVDPNGKKYEVFNSSRKFGEEMDIDVRKFEKLKDGEIFKIKQLRKDTPQRVKNTEGWSRFIL